MIFFSLSTLCKNAIVGTDERTRLILSISFFDFLCFLSSIELTIKSLFDFNQFRKTKLKG